MSSKNLGGDECGEGEGVSGEDVPDVVAVEGGFVGVDGTEGGHFLEIGEDGGVLDMDEKVDDEEDIAVGGKGAFVRGVYFSGGGMGEWQEEDRGQVPAFAPDLDWNGVSEEERK